MRHIYLNSALKCDSFDVAIDIKIPFVRFLVAIEPGRSLVQFVMTNCLIRETHPFLVDLSPPWGKLKMLKVGFITDNITYRAKRISP